MMSRLKEWIWERSVTTSALLIAEDVPKIARRTRLRGAAEETRLATRFSPVGSAYGQF